MFRDAGNPRDSYPGWPRPKRISNGFLHRLLFVRLVFTALAVSTLDAAVAELAAGYKGTDGSHLRVQWGWQGRVGLLGLLLPLLFNLAGLLWPFIDLQGFEQHFLAFHKVLMAVSVLGKLLEECSSFRQLRGSCQQHMLLHGLLFIVHQEPTQQFLQQLALVVMAYAGCHLAVSGGVPLPGDDGTGGGGGAGGSNSDLAGSWSSSSLLGVTTSGEFFVNGFMVLMLLHQLFQAVMPDRLQADTRKQQQQQQQVEGRCKAGTGLPSNLASKDQQQQQQPPANVARPVSGSSSPAHAAARISTSGGSFSSVLVAQPALMPSPAQHANSSSTATAGAPAGISSAGWQQLPTLQRLAALWHGLQQPQQQQPGECLLTTDELDQQQQQERQVLSTAYVAKLVAVKTTNAVFVTVYALKCLPYLSAARDAAASSPAVVNPCFVGLLCAAVLLLQVGLAVTTRHFYARHVRLINAASFYICLASRLLLVHLHNQLQKSSGSSSQECSLQLEASASSKGLTPEHMFHSFLMLVFSLSTNEDPPAAFALQLLLLMFLYRHVHVVLAAAGDAAAAAAAVASVGYFEEFPEYFMVSALVLALYRWMCVGIYQPVVRSSDQPAAVATAAGSSSRLQPSGSRQGSFIAKQPSTMATAAAAAAAAVRSRRASFAGSLGPRASIDTCRGSFDSRLSTPTCSGRLQDYLLQPVGTNSRALFQQKEVWHEQQQEQEQQEGVAGAADMEHHQQHQYLHRFESASIPSQLEPNSCLHERTAVRSGSLPPAASADLTAAAAAAAAVVVAAAAADGSLDGGSSSSLQQVFQANAALPRWTSQHLRQLSSSTFEITVDCLGGYDGSAAAEEAAETAAVATAAAFCMASPVLLANMAADGAVHSGAAAAAATAAPAAAAATGAAGAGDVRVGAASAMVRASSACELQQLLATVPARLWRQRRCSRDNYYQRPSSNYSSFRSGSLDLLPELQTMLPRGAVPGADAWAAPQSGGSTGRLPTISSRARTRAQKQQQQQLPLQIQPLDDGSTAPGTPCSTTASSSQRTSMEQVLVLPAALQQASLEKEQQQLQQQQQQQLQPLTQGLVQQQAQPVLPPQYTPAEFVAGPPMEALITDDDGDDDDDSRCVAQEVYPSVEQSCGSATVPGASTSDPAVSAAVAVPGPAVTADAAGDDSPGRSSSGSSSSSRQLLGTHGHWQKQQLLARDALMCVLELLLDPLGSWSVLWATGAGTGMAGRSREPSSLCLVLAAGEMALCLIHLLLLLLRPKLVAARRARHWMWLVRLCVAPSLVHAAAVAAGMPAADKSLSLLCFLGSAWGLLDLSPRLVASWVPYCVASFFGLHAWSSWPHTSQRQLVLDAVHFHMWPVLAFMSGKGLAQLFAWVLRHTSLHCSRMAAAAIPVQQQQQRQQPQWPPPAAAAAAATGWSLQRHWTACCSSLQLLLDRALAVSPEQHGEAAAGAQGSFSSRCLHRLATLCCAVALLGNSVGKLVGRQVPHLHVWLVTAAQLLTGMLILAAAGSSSSRLLMFSYVFGAPGPPGAVVQQPGLALNNSTAATGSSTSFLGDGGSSNPYSSSSNNSSSSSSSSSAGVSGHVVLAWVGKLKPAIEWAAAQRMLARMDLQLFTQMRPDSLQTLGGVLLVCLSFLLISGVQALVIHSSWFRNPRQLWYEAAKRDVLALGEHTLSAAVSKRSSTGSNDGDQEVDALLETLREVVQPLFPGCAMVLTLLEDGTLESGFATQHYALLPGDDSDSSGSSPPAGSSSTSGGGNSSGFLPPLQLPLSDLPSVQAVCQGRRLLFTSQFSTLCCQQEEAQSSGGDAVSAPLLAFWDWQMLSEQLGVDCFLAVPLCFHTHDLGCLLLMSAQPHELDSVARKLAIELGLVVAQTLYTLMCMQQMRAEQALINDIMPEKVAEQLKRRLITARQASAASFSSSLGQTSSLLLGSDEQQQQQQQVSVANDNLLPLRPEHLLFESGSYNKEKHGRRETGSVYNVSATTADITQLLSAQNDGGGAGGAGGAGAGGAGAGGAGAAAQGQSLLLQQLRALSPFGGSSGGGSGGGGDRHSQHLPRVASTPAFTGNVSTAATGVTRAFVSRNSISFNTACSSSGSTIAAATAGGSSALAPGTSSSSGGGAAVSGRLAHCLAAAPGLNDSLLSGSGGVASEGLASPRQQRASADISAAAVAYKQWHANVSVLFADIVGYTSLSQSVQPEQVMLLLHQLFSRYDNLCSAYGVYKVETIGDCWMGATGLLADDPDHACNMVGFARDILAAAASVPSPLGGSVQIRVGIHSGLVMSGVVGSIRARYCLFGDTVNMASRMESTGLPGRVQVSEDTFQLLLPSLQLLFEPREAVAVKGKGCMRTFVMREEQEQQQEQQQQEQDQEQQMTADEVLQASGELVASTVVVCES